MSFGQPASVSRLATVLADESLALRLLAGGADGTVAMTGVIPVNGLAELDAAPSGSLAVITEEWDRQLTGYQVDVALRHAAAAPICGLIFPRPRSLATSARHLADRAGLPVIGCRTEGQSAWRLALRLDRILRQPDVERSSLIRRAITAATDPAHDPDALVRRVAEVLQCKIELGPEVDHEPDQGSAQIPGVRPAILIADRTDAAIELVLPVLAQAVGRLNDDQLSRARAPGRVRSQLILQLLSADRSQVPDLAAEAEAAGMPIHQTHIGGWLKIARPAGAGRAAAGQRLVRLLERVEAELITQGPAVWHVIMLSGGIAVVCTRPVGDARLYRSARSGLQGLVEELSSDDLPLTGGLGGAAGGAEGLRRSVAEARMSAERAVEAGNVGSLADTDRAGLRRILTDLGASPLSGGLLADLLAPLDELPPDRTRLAVETLQAYLDAQGSPTKAAAALHLHPNAVSYRLRWINDALGLDLADPDQRFAVHLACRMRLNQ